MQVKTASLKSRQRARVLDAYRARGRRNNSLWLVHSVKTNRDLLLTSDRQLVHWLFFLESDRDVRHFEIDAGQEDGKDPAYVHVHRTDGTKEKHLIVPRLSVEQEYAAFPELASSSLTSSDVRFFTDVELKPVVQVAMRWHKALAYASVLRDHEHLPVRLALVSCLASRQSGTLSDVLEDAIEFNQALVIGMFVKLAIEGYIEIDLSKHGIAFKTQWRLTVGGERVES